MPPYQGQRTLLVCLIALALMWADQRYPAFQSLRNIAGYVLYPAQQLAVLPSSLANWMDESTTSRRDLLDQNKQLSARNLVLELKAQRLASLEAENIELRELLSASEQVDDKVLVTTVIAVDPDPYTKQILINKGGDDGVFVGQPVLDAHGLLGQVVDVLPHISHVMMIADSNHAIPVQINRNGVRAIATGTGALDRLELIYVPNTADIQEGDLLVSSGLGGRYPRGYPVATVEKVEHQAGELFASVTARPSALMDRSRLLLLVFSQGAGKVPSDELWRKNR
ncbi:MULTISPECIES: rod shape-determining protein MreC [unclassified Oceanobacter]|uniref:rod shape-determining protein MreC n=1 Tax=Oceanobacter sp. 1_MG-2023 TaxID=3062618 RepID=UPI0026E1DECC|nr:MULTISPECIES: rod shape-determining protein MreC [unclassified Oceanobacter]MDO6681998.1 rod shape-determining protein MreC [Oceanobacter sp. 5_MG-2023]MDP2505360.1 rod shape-determining protein MreC [Oceanobacter sp. 3_MG-2023]MDP2548034.1 rod shape-determining protein MreC [Oceanobacter sp. 4_MG-2023]MDP2610112.1 rod shape-determining protein MreC [Oceanobacter sp. 1_MG-2023]MDP2612313.1 rod shape-determining protein MreC [Oceanobacter sp. 2_MG-2023]